MTTESNHTPAPWKIKESLLGCRGGENVNRLIISKDAYEVAVINPWMNKRIPRQDADARLIAAAPDMLAALVKIDAWILEHQGVYDEATGFLFESILQVADEAMKKARGE